MEKISSQAQHKMLRERIIDKIDPIANLVAIANGESLPGIPTPTPFQVYDANVRLLNKILPDLKSVEIKDDAPPSADEVTDDVLERISGVIALATIAKSKGYTPSNGVVGNSKAEAITEC